MESKQFIPDIPEKTTEIQVNQENECPNCSEELYISGKCKTCYNCGWSSCDL